MCVGGIKRGHCRVPFRALPFKGIAVAGIYSNRLPSVVGAQIFAVAMGELILKALACSTLVTVQHVPVTSANDIA
jgi:hypothetical protein